CALQQSAVSGQGGRAERAGAGEPEGCRVGQHGSSGRGELDDLGEVFAGPRTDECERSAVPDSGRAGDDEWRVLNGRQSLRVQGPRSHGCYGVADGDRMEELAAEAGGSVPEEEWRRGGAADLDKRT